ncbi:hypothetical protein [Proteus phage 3H10_20]|uniref:Uncharacterized protein n=1 Tax=Proteus phage 3H10_20 TaxID=2772448 RepID=A0A7L7SG96_9CAUD|nr:hypothetical protein PQC37_gp010 [Proteus phage 3H10_20]QOC54796.1 hypothetical protein [Proteus phage 3H10_20]
MWGLLLRGFYLFFSNLVIVLFGEPMVRWVFFKGANWLVKLTPTKLDDKFIQKLEEEYKKKHGE